MLLGISHQDWLPYVLTGLVSALWGMTTIMRRMASHKGRNGTERDHHLIPIQQEQAGKVDVATWREWIKNDVHLEAESGRALMRQESAEIRKLLTEIMERIDCPVRPPANKNG